MLNLLKYVFSSLQRHKVRYIVIGGIAAVLYGVPRATFDLDILIDAKAENAKKLLEAFLEAKLGTAALTTVDELISQAITIFKERVRIDVQTSLPGLNFEEAWERRETMEYQKQKFYVASREDLISSKRAAGRPVDLKMCVCSNPKDNLYA